MKLKLKKYIYLLLPLSFAGCQSTETEILPTDSNDRVIFGASYNGILESRASGGRKMVVDKDYNLTFKGPDGYEFGNVDFNSSGIGYSTRLSDGSNVDLLWSYVNSDKPDENTYSFYLDNLPKFYMHDPVVYFPDENIYQLAEYIPENESDPENGKYSNDLYWGSVEDVSRKAVEEVDLYPVMARFCLRVYFDNSAVGEDKFPSSATINNIFHSAVSFDRLTGTFSFQRFQDVTPLPEEEPFTLVETESEWEEFYDEENEMTYYVSPDFILPPQEFVSNMRPRLSLTVRTGESSYSVYSGLLPLTMSLVGNDGQISPWVMSFLKGYKLTLNVKISNDASGMQFMPAYLIDWNDIGIKNISGHQASVSKKEDFKDLIEAYTKGKTQDFYNWGYLDSNNINIFNIFQNLEIEADDVKGLMPEDLSFPYKFNLYNAIVTVILPDGQKAYLRGSEGADQLKKLLSEGIYPDPNEEPEPDPVPDTGSGEDDSKDPENS